MGSIGAEKATNARAIENMNEAQIDKEIRAAERRLASAERAIERNGQTAQEKAMQEAFPLGVGGDGWTAARRRQFDRQRDASLARATRYTEAVQRRDEAQRRIEQLQTAKNEVRGTGKTQAQLREERVKQAIKNTESTLKWKTTQKGGFDGSVYTPKIIKAGAYEIHGSSGLYTIYKNGKMVGRTDKLSKAKAYAERNK